MGIQRKTREDQETVLRSQRVENDKIENNEITECEQSFKEIESAPNPYGDNDLVEYLENLNPLLSIRAIRFDAG